MTGRHQESGLPQVSTKVSRTSDQTTRELSFPLVPGYICNVGLTIHYELTVPNKWSIQTVREKLEAVRQACMDLPVVDVSEPSGIHGRRVPGG